MGYLLPAAIFMFFHPPTAGAQMSTGLPDILRTSAASYYYVAKSGELTMQVNVWGYVKNPGRYEIPTSTNLIQLISYAGGPLTDASTDDVRVIREGKGAGGSGAFSYEVDLEDLAGVDPERLLLYPGDTILLDHTSWLNVRDALLIVTAMAVVTSAVATVIIAESR